MKILYAKQSNQFIVIIFENNTVKKITGKLKEFNSDFVYYYKTGLGYEIYYVSSSEECQNEHHLNLNSSRYL